VVSTGGHRSPDRLTCFESIGYGGLSIPALDNQAQPGGSQVRWQFADRPKWSTPQVVWPALAITRAPRGMAHDSRLTACLALIDPKGATCPRTRHNAPGKVGLSKYSCLELNRRK